MMAFKLIGLLVVAGILAPTTQGASIRKLGNGERIAALYVKDNSNGELRFLGGGGGFGTSNAQLNQFITQKQDLLEQMRPTGSSTGTGSGTASTASGFGTGSGGVTPIVVNAGGTSSTSSTNTGISSSIINSNPIAGVLPNLIAQAVFTRGSPNNRRRGVNQRRRNNRRKSNRGGGKNKPQIYVIRPKY